MKQGHQWIPANKDKRRNLGIIVRAVATNTSITGITTDNAFLREIERVDPVARSIARLNWAWSEESKKRASVHTSYRD
jgi:hypothetical protein